MAEQNNWEIFKADNYFEILANEPHTIRRIKDGFIPKISKDKSQRYNTLYLNQQQHLCHRILAIQFLLILNNLPNIDHKNGLQFREFKSNSISKLQDYVNFVDIEQKRVQISINKLKNENYE